MAERVRLLQDVSVRVVLVPRDLRRSVHDHRLGEDVAACVVGERGLVSERVLRAEQVAGAVPAVLHEDELGLVLFSHRDEEAVSTQGTAAKDESGRDQQDNRGDNHYFAILHCSTLYEFTMISHQVTWARPRCFAAASEMPNSTPIWSYR